MIRYKIHGIDEIKRNIKAKFYTLSGVIDELNYLSKDKKIKKEFGIIKQIIKNEKITILKSNNNVDEELIKKSNEYIIATNDKELRKKIRENNGKSIFIRKLTLVDMNEITH
jgi:rRNA-processing protein FCF1